MFLRVGAFWLGLAAAAVACAQFEGDSRLERHVNLRFDANPIREVLFDVRKQTGVELSVAQDIREDLIVLLWRDKPAANLLELIADHFDWTWEKRDGGYRLQRTKEQREDEERSRIESILAPYRERQAMARQRIAEIKNSDHAKAKELFEALSVGIAQQDVGTKTPSGSDGEARMRAVQDVDLPSVSGATAIGGMMKWIGLEQTGRDSDPHLVCSNYVRCITRFSPSRSREDLPTDWSSLLLLLTRTHRTSNSPSCRSDFER